MEVASLVPVSLVMDPLLLGGPFFLCYTNFLQLGSDQLVRCCYCSRHLRRCIVPVARRQPGPPDLLDLLFEFLQSAFRVLDLLVELRVGEGVGLSRLLLGFPPREAKSGRGMIESLCGGSTLTCSEPRWRDPPP